MRRYVFVCSLYDVSCGGVLFVCLLFVFVYLVVCFEIKCVAAVFVSYVVVMCGVVWSVYLCFCFVCDLLSALFVVFECCL